RELLARVRVALRHATGQLNSPVFETGNLRIDFDQHLAMVDGRGVPLTSKENAVLRFLVAHAGKVLTQRMILREVWGPDYVGESQYLRNIITSLRRKLEEDPAHPRLILTEIGTGYRFRAFSDA